RSARENPRSAQPVAQRPQQDQRGGFRGMGRRTRYVLSAHLGFPIYPLAGKQRPWRTRPGRRSGCGEIRERDIRLYGLFLFPAITCGRQGRLPVVRQSGQRGKLIARKIARENWGEKVAS